MMLRTLNLVDTVDFNASNHRIQELSAKMHRQELKEGLLSTKA